VTKLIAQDFSYMAEPERTHIMELQAEMIRLQDAGSTDSSDTLWHIATRSLGNADERYCGIFTCLNCGQLYHHDYSTATIVDCCGLECEVAIDPSLSEDEDE
jgi:hypothetical protein